MTQSMWHVFGSTQVLFRSSTPLSVPGLLRGVSARTIDHHCFACGKFGLFGNITLNLGPWSFFMINPRCSPCRTLFSAYAFAPRQHSSSPKLSLILKRSYIYVLEEAFLINKAQQELVTVAIPTSSLWSMPHPQSMVDIHEH